jgi:fermentation-respiration switch protein FrsA (DUF1100 family)
MKRRLLVTLAFAVVAPGTAAAAPPNPFGHACTPQDGVLFCPTAADPQRVPSFDGVPLDVDVTLPATGDGPFPTIVMMHGWGGNKGAFEATGTEAGDYSNVFYARRGYAVVNYSARGFGRSCGTPDSRTAPACDRGWLHLSDHRFEARDTQHLVGLLVDQGVVERDAIGVTGISYGGIQSLNLARLRDRIRRPDGSYARWRSPNGTPLRIAAAWARWGGSDLTSSLTPNGRFLDFGPTTPAQSREPLGVMKLSYVNGLYVSGNAAGFIAAEGADPGADLGRWRNITDRGEPYGRDAVAVARELSSFHSMVGLTGTPAPLLVQNGWTDDLFPAPEALRVYSLFKRARRARVSLQLGDFGHPRGANKPNEDRLFARQGAAFFDAWLKGSGAKPAHRAVTAFTQTCPAERPSGGPFRSASWEGLHPGRARLSAPRTQRVISSGGDPAAMKAFDPIGSEGACVTIPGRTPPGTANAKLRIRRPFTMLGLPTVRARIATRGRGGFLAAHLYDVFRGRQTLVARGVYRLENNQKGRLRFQLFGNGWRFRKGHVAKLELRGNDPDFLRTSNDRFSVRVSDLRVGLPARERLGRRR